MEADASTDASIDTSTEASIEARYARPRLVSSDFAEAQAAPLAEALQGVSAVQEAAKPEN